MHISQAASTLNALPPTCLLGSLQPSAHHETIFGDVSEWEHSASTTNLWAAAVLSSKGLFFSECLQGSSHIIKHIDRGRRIFLVHLINGSTTVRAQLVTHKLSRESFLSSLLRYFGQPCGHCLNLLISPPLNLWHGSTLHAQAWTYSSERNADLCEAPMSVILVICICSREGAVFCPWHWYYFSFVISQIWQRSRCLKKNLGEEPLLVL